MDAKVHCHFVINDMEEHSTVLSMLFLDPVDLTIPCHHMTTVSRFQNEMVDVFVFFSSCWVLLSTKIFVMSLGMLIEKVRVDKLGVSPSSSKLINKLFLVE